MEVETAAYIAKAQKDINDARVAADVGLKTVAARLVYYAMFHLAEALIFERSDKTAKTHTGVRAEFARVSRYEPSIDPSFGRFLAQSYIYKETADYAIIDPLDISKAEVATR